MAFFISNLEEVALLYTPGKLNVFSSRKPELRGTSLTEELDVLLSSQVVQSQGSEDSPKLTFVRVHTLSPIHSVSNKHCRGKANFQSR